MSEIHFVGKTRYEDLIQSLALKPCKVYVVNNTGSCHIDTCRAV